MPHDPGKSALTGPEELRSTSVSLLSVLLWDALGRPTSAICWWGGSPGRSVPARPGRPNALALRGSRGTPAATGSDHAADMHVLVLSLVLLMLLLLLLHLAWLPLTLALLLWLLLRLLADDGACHYRMQLAEMQKSGPSDFHVKPCLEKMHVILRLRNL